MPNPNWDALRAEYEPRLGSPLFSLFAAAQAKLDSHQALDWGGFQNAAQGIYEQHQRELYTAVALVLLPDELSGREAFSYAGGLQYSRGEAPGFAESLTARTRSLVLNGRRSEAFTAGRANTIAITETTRGISAATVGSAQIESDEGRRAEGLPPGERQGPLSLPVGLLAKWITSRLPNVCPVCRPLDGKSEAVWGLLFPGGPPAHRGCNCDLVIQHR